MKYRGPKLSVSQMLAAAEFDEERERGRSPGVAAVRFTAAGNAAAAAELLRRREGLGVAWRHGILQTVDDYGRALRSGGVDSASAVFEEEPEDTGSVEMDAAFAALADDMSTRDGWAPPTWAMNERRRVTEWFPSVPAIFLDEARRDSPDAWRRRGIYITSRSLARA